jgi:hypothetical protein
VRFAGLILIPLLALHGEDLPEASALLERSTHAFDGYESFQFQSTVSVITALPARTKSPPIVTSASVTGMSVGKLRVESKNQDPGGGGVMTVVSDGQATSNYLSGRPEYKRREGAIGIAASLDLAGVWSGSLPVDATPPRAVRQEWIVADGEMRDCWVVERGASKVIPPGNVHYELDDLKWTAWIDKKLGIDWRISVIGKLYGTLPEAEVTVTKTELRVDPDLPDSSFTYVPPRGSSQVTEFYTTGVR